MQTLCSIGPSDNRNVSDLDYCQDTELALFFTPGSLLAYPHRLFDRNIDRPLSIRETVFEKVNRPRDVFDRSS